MTIYKTDNFTEAYRAKAGSKDINELSGRTGRPDLTAFVTRQILSKLSIKSDSTIIDLGCGDGSLLVQLAMKGNNGYEGRLIGVLPTIEEVRRVRDEILMNQKTPKALISIEIGLAEKTNFPDEYCDLLVNNGVVVILQKLEKVKAALTEFNRITKPGGSVFIGEVPDRDEMADKNYGDGITSWLLYVLKTQGFKPFLIRFKQTLIALLSREPFVIAPKTLFYMPPDEFITLLSQHGLRVIEHYRHLEINNQGQENNSKTRWNYICIKE